MPKRIKIYVEEVNGGIDGEVWVERPDATLDYCYLVAIDPRDGRYWCAIGEVSLWPPAGFKFEVLALGEDARDIETAFVNVELLFNEQFLKGRLL